MARFRLVSQVYSQARVMQLTDHMYFPESRSVPI